MLSPILACIGPRIAGTVVFNQAAGRHIASHRRMPSDKPGTIQSLHFYMFGRRLRCASRRQRRCEEIPARRDIGVGQLDASRSWPYCSVVLPNAIAEVNSEVCDYRDSDRYPEVRRGLRPDDARGRDSQPRDNRRR